MTEDDVREALGWTKTLLTQRLQLLELGEPIQEALTSDRITVAQARTIGELPDEQHERFIDVAASLPTARLREMVQSEIQRREAIDAPEPLDDEPDPEEADTDTDDDADDLNAVEMARIIDGRLCDLISYCVDNETPSHTRMVYTARSIEWGALGNEDLDGLVSILTTLCEVNDCVGTYDPAEGDEDDAPQAVEEE